MRTPILTTTFQTWRFPYLQFQKLQGISGTHPRSQASSFLTTTQATRVAGPPKDPGLGLSFQFPRGSPGIPQLLAGQHPAAAPLCPHTAGRPQTSPHRRGTLPRAQRPSPLPPLSSQDPRCPQTGPARLLPARSTPGLPVPFPARRAQFGFALLGAPPCAGLASARPAACPEGAGTGLRVSTTSFSFGLAAWVSGALSDVFLLLGNSLPARSGVPFPLPTSW